MAMTSGEREAFVLLVNMAGTMLTAVTAGMNSIEDESDRQTVMDAIKSCASDFQALVTKMQKEWEKQG